MNGWRPTDGQIDVVNTDIYQDNSKPVRLQTLEDTAMIENIYLATIFHHSENEGWVRGRLKTKMKHDTRQPANYQGLSLEWRIVGLL